MSEKNLERCKNVYKTRFESLLRNLLCSPMRIMRCTVRLLEVCHIKLLVIEVFFYQFEDRNRAYDFSDEMDGWAFMRQSGT